MGVSEDETSVKTPVMTTAPPDAGYLTLVKEFDGKLHDGVSVNEFLLSVSQTGKLANWSEDYMITIAKLRMTGRARIFRDGNEAFRDLNTWSAFSKAMKDRFGNKDPKAVHVTKYMNAQQHENESVVDFASRLLALARKAHPTEADEKPEQKSARQGILQTTLLVQFTLGLKNERIKRAVNEAGLTTLDEAVEKAVQLEGSEKLFAAKDEPEVALVNAARYEMKKGPRLDLKKLQIEAAASPAAQAADFSGAQYAGANAAVVQGANLQPPPNYAAQNAAQGGFATANYADQNFARANQGYHNDPRQNFNNGGNQGGRYDYNSRGRGYFNRGGQNQHDQRRWQPRSSNFRGGAPRPGQSGEQRGAEPPNRFEQRPFSGCRICGAANHMARGCLQLTHQAQHRDSLN